MEKTPKEIFKPKLFSDQHQKLEKEWPGIHELIYESMREFSRQSLKGKEASEDPSQSEASKGSKWISVDERPPEIGKIVTVTLKHSKKDVYAAFRAKGGWYCFRIGEESKQFIPDGINEVKITHWMPLPEPPNN